MKFKSLFIALLPALLPVASSCSSAGKTDAGQPTDSLTATRMLKARLDTVASRGQVIFGHQDDPVYGHTWWADEGRSDVLETAGDYPGIMSWDLGGIELGDSVNLDGVNFQRMRREVIAQDARGGINAFSWHTRNPVDGNDSWGVADTTIVAQIINNPEYNAKFRDQVRTVARFFNSLTDADGNKIAVIFRPWHEHTGDWFWWGTPICSTADYITLWHQTREVMDEEGVDNVVWAYSPDRVKSEEQYMERYPGDEYVDLLGVDVYHYGADQGVDTYLTDAGRSLGIVRSLAQRHGKLTAFTETGSESLPMEGWWTEVLLPLLEENPVSYVVVWRNASDKPNHYYAPYPGQKSAESFKKFRDNPKTVFASDLKDIR